MPALKADFKASRPCQPMTFLTNQASYKAPEMLIVVFKPQTTEIRISHTSARSVVLVDQFESYSMLAASDCYHGSDVLHLRT